jgi:hypothetical protein
MRVVVAKASRGEFRGPLFGDDEGVVLRSKAIEIPLMEKLQWIKELQPGLIPEKVEVFEDFGISQSFRRGATSMARVEVLTINT